MTWSLLTPKVRSVLTAAEAQRNEPGINQIDNCGPACVACLMMIHGYPDIEPQDLVGPYYRGGTTGPQLNGIIAKRYPNPPPMAYVSSSADPIGDLAGWAAKGWLSMGLFWSDAAAVVKPYNTGIGHWCVPVADDGSAITFWNPEWGAFNRLSHSDFLKASWRQFDVCQRAVISGEVEMELLIGDSNGGVDPLGKGAVYITDGLRKRHCLSQGEVDAWSKLTGKGVQSFDQGALDRIPVEQTVPIGAAGSITVDYNALLAAVKAIKPASGATVDLQPVLTKLDNLTLKAS